MDDKYILDKFWPNKISILKRKENANLVSIEEREYLQNRYADSSSIYESLYRIKNGIECAPTCKVCGKKCSYNDSHKGYSKYCSSKCQWNDPDTINARKKAIFEKYGSYSTMSDPKVVKKSKEKWALKTPEEIRKIKEKQKVTSIKNNGIDNWCGQKKNKLHWKQKSKEEIDAITEKKKHTFLTHYGVDNYTKTEEWKEHASCIAESVQYKGYLTKKANNTFNTSQPEEELYLYIREKFPDVERQHRDAKRYPFMCDFYIPSLDYFIELNAHWTHYTHPYDPYNIEDQKKVEEWKSKHTRFYDLALRCWTISDPKKRNIAKKNNLNYKEVWTLEEGKSFIDELFDKEYYINNGI